MLTAPDFKDVYSDFLKFIVSVCNTSKFVITAHNGNVCDFPFLMKCIRMNNLGSLPQICVGAFDVLVSYKHQRLGEIEAVVSKKTAKSAVKPPPIIKFFLQDLHDKLPLTSSGKHSLKMGDLYFRISPLQM